MSESRRCPQCGAELPADAPDAPCPACLMKLGLESWAERDGNPPGQDVPATQAPSGRFEAPQPEELAPHFPQLEIIGLLGVGGMGAVYKARQPGLDRLVALKILPPEVGQDPAFAERFTREARALAKLNHPNIVSVFDFGQADDLYYLVMEFVDGVNLRETIRTGKLQPPEALAIVPQICDALQFAHDEGVVHRDIKPENILVDTKGRVKIADFGLAKLLGKAAADFTLTGTHQAMGTLHYMAPEQMEKPLQVDHRADIYSLGVVFYEMLTGELPIGRFAAPSKKVQIDVRLDEVVLRALENKPEQRYQHVSEVKTDVEAITGSAAPSESTSPGAGSEEDRLEQLILSHMPATKASAIDLYREKTATGPSEALYAVEAIARKHGIQFTTVSDHAYFRYMTILTLICLTLWAATQIALHWGDLAGAEWYSQKRLYYRSLNGAFVILSFISLAYGSLWYYLLAKDPGTPRSLQGWWSTWGTPDRRVRRVWLPLLICLGLWWTALAVVTWQNYQEWLQLLVHVGGILGAPFAFMAMLWWAIRQRTPAGGTAAEPADAADSDAIYSQVKGPATGLLITGILNWIGIPALAGILALIALRQDLPMMMSWLALMAFVVSGLIILGALKMRRLEAYGASITSSILAMIVSPGSLVGFPIGIWALVVLSRKEVRAAFVGKRKHDKPATDAEAHHVAEPSTIEGPADGLILVAGVALLTAIGVGLWLRFAAFGWDPEASRHSAQARFQFELASLAVTLAVYALVIATAGIQMRRLRGRLYALLCTVIAGVFVPAVLALNVIMEHANMTRGIWMVMIPIWLGVPVAVWSIIVLYRRDVRATFKHASRDRQEASQGGGLGLNRD